MARPSSPTLTEAELRLMKVLWKRGPSTTSEILAELADREVELAGSSVRTILGIFEEKGAVTSKLESRTKIYRALMSRAEARRSAMEYFLSRFFDGSREELLLNLIGDEEVDEAELKRLRRLVLEGGKDDG